MKGEKTVLMRIVRCSSGDLAFNLHNNLIRNIVFKGKIVCKISIRKTLIIKNKHELNENNN